MTGNTAAAEEIMSGFFLQVWQQSERYDPERGRVMIWLLTMFRLHALDWRRRHSGALLPVGPEPPQGFELPRSETARSEDDPRAWTRLYKPGTAVHTAVEMLDERARYLVGLNFLGGLSPQEISQHTAMPVDTVKTALRNALSVLHERLHHFGVVKAPR